jgi:hypothetical protein
MNQTEIRREDGMRYLMNALSDAIVCRRSSAAVYSSRLQRIVVAYHYIVAGRRGGDPGS